MNNNIPKGFVLIPKSTIEELKREVDILFAKHPLKSSRGDLEHLMDIVNRTVSIAHCQG